MTEVSFSENKGGIYGDNLASVPKTLVQISESELNSTYLESRRLL